MAASISASSCILSKSLLSHGCQKRLTSLPSLSSASCIARMPRGTTWSSAAHSGSRSITKSVMKFVNVESDKIMEEVECSSSASTEETVHGFPTGQVSAAATFFLLQNMVVSLPAQALEFPEIAFLNSKEVEGIFYIIIFALGYLFVAPPIVFNYLRLRWFKRSMPETIFQYYLFFLFFPAMLLWSPFINFRAIPRDPSER